MKLLTFITLFVFSLTIQAQTTHTLTAYDHYFDPDTLYVEPGDSVELISIGYHSATQIDSLDWENNNANHNGGFYVGFGAPTNEMTFAVNNLGTHYLICVPHAGMGMKGIIIAANNVGINEVLTSENYHVTALENNRLNVRYSQCDEFMILDMTGKLLLSAPLPTHQEQKNMAIHSLATGVYIGHFRLNGQAVQSVKFIVH